jgi:hypothetical protein
VSDFDEGGKRWPFPAAQSVGRVTPPDGSDPRGYGVGAAGSVTITAAECVGRWPAGTILLRRYPSPSFPSPQIARAQSAMMARLGYGMGAILDACPWTHAGVVMSATVVEEQTFPTACFSSWQDFAGGAIIRALQLVPSMCPATLDAFLFACRADAMNSEPYDIGELIDDWEQAESALGGAVRFLDVFGERSTHVCSTAIAANLVMAGAWVMDEKDILACWPWWFAANKDALAVIEEVRVAG